MKAIIYFGNNTTKHVFGQKIINNVITDINIIYDELKTKDKLKFDNFINEINNYNSLTINNLPFEFNGDIVFDHVVDTELNIEIDYTKIPVDFKTKIDLFFGLM